MSDILIRGMEMPDKDHLVLVEIDNNGDVFAAYDGGRTKLTQHKAVPIQPHGRLVDADALEDELGRFCDDNWVYNTLHHAPTIIPASE